MQNSALYRYPTGRASFGKFNRDPFCFLWEEKPTSSMVADQLDCTLLCVGEPKCYSFNIAAFSDPKGLYLCELLATNKYRATGKFFSNATFHHFSPLSPCESDPCMNGGVCVPEYKWNSYHCDCKPEFCGAHCEPRGDRTCSEIKRCNLPSGSYFIDPDGEGGEKPFKVHCDMTDNGGVGVTVVGHDSENRTQVNGFDSAGSYSRNVTYRGATIFQLASLTASSAHCEQFIMYECYHSRLLYNNRPMFGWWVSRDGEKMKYWGGVDSVPYKCACGLNNSCANPGYGCNCDKNDNVKREDSGFLTDKSKLPVTQLRFGDA
ncbi:contactin-associated protein-like 2 [Stylophora pistillata]|uniref:Contactin-associated protein-like 2 n=1 Tax=Stylophora pistillata TaxID=50429 RepID=A0A2B4RAT1_STYPI|nr:contactin-associated protein-like 2 [Stylophora pistillata]PFX13919.1 Contactin-associated protein-like 2 [Stylophora pistillata]